MNLREPGGNRAEGNRTPRYHRDPKRIAISTLILAGILGFAVWCVWMVLGVVFDWLSGPKQYSDVLAEAQSQAEETVSAPTAPALDYTSFDPGNIISDEEFYDPDTMTAAEIAEFIAEWNDGCQPGSDGTVCLADYTADTASIEADKYCTGYEGQAGDSAASIIYKSANACGINPQVLITLMQKEQSLVTASGASLTEDRYLIAMGFGCPDTDNCDTTYYGFANQVYYAARQFQIYRQTPEEFDIVAGQENYIQYGPGCSGSWVYVENQATASLYNYTPYQPDFMAYTGSEDTCSTPGNLNFYAFYEAWFGDS